jgi:hypothetical protein
MVNGGNFKIAAGAVRCKGDVKEIGLETMLLSRESVFHVGR